MYVEVAGGTAREDYAIATLTNELARASDHAGIKLRIKILNAT